MKFEFEVMNRKSHRRHASDPKITIDKLPFSEMFLIREEFSESQESDTQQFVEEEGSASGAGEEDIKIKLTNNNTITEESDSKSSLIQNSETN